MQYLITFAIKQQGESHPNINLDLDHKLDKPLTLSESTLESQMTFFLRFCTDFST